MTTTLYYIEAEYTDNHVHARLNGTRRAESAEDAESLFRADHDDRVLVNLTVREVSAEEQDATQKAWDEWMQRLWT